MREIEIRSGGKFAVFGSVESAFEIIDFRADVNAAGKRLAETVGTDSACERRKGGEFAERKINFGDRAVGANVADAQRESGIELRRIHEIEECALGVDAGDHRFDGNFFAIWQAPRRWRRHL